MDLILRSLLPLLQLSLALNVFSLHFARPPACNPLVIFMQNSTVFMIRGAVASVGYAVSFRRRFLSLCRAPGVRNARANHKRCVMIMVRSWAVVGILKINIGKLPGQMDFFHHFGMLFFHMKEFHNQTYLCAA